MCFFRKGLSGRFVGPLALRASACKPLEREQAGRKDRLALCSSDHIEPDKARKQGGI